MLAGEIIIPWSRMTSLLTLLLLAATAPPAEISTIAVPIRADLSALTAEVEARVPKSVKDDEVQKGITIEYDVLRDPIVLRMIGPGLHANTVARYRLQACRGRFPCISCGISEPRREAQITLHSKLEWDASWRIKSTTRPLPVGYPKRCNVTWFDFDITRRYIAPEVEKQLTIAARTIDHNVPLLTSIRPQAQQIWSSLQTPVELAPRTWLVLEPVSVALTPIAGAGMIATSTLTLQARTRVVVGNKPAATATPLPPLRVAASPATGIRIPLDLELPYEEASRLISAEFAGKTYKVNKRDLRVESIRIMAGAEGKLLLEAMIDYRGGAMRNYRGLVWLEGTPRFDAATSSVVVPDLDYTLERRRRNPFLQLVERAVHTSLRAELREAAHFAIGPRIEAVRGEIGRALTRRLAPNVFLRGKAEVIQPVSVTPLPTTIAIRILATGAAEVEIRNR
jgi:Domain of unknown function (DUF4403)